MAQWLAKVALAALGPHLDSGLKARLQRGPGVGRRFSVKRLLARWMGP